MSSSDDLIKQLRASQNEDILSPIESVPRMEMSAFVARLGKVWPRRADSTTIQIHKFWELQKPYLWTQIWALEHHNKMYATLNAFSAVYLGGIFRHTLKITAGLGAVNILLPTIAGGTMFGMFLHAKHVLMPMCYDPDSNHETLIFKSTILHLVTSFWYPLMFSPVAAVFYAARYSTFPIPEDFFKSKASRQYLMDKILRPTFKRSRTGLVATLAINSFAAGAMTFNEGKQVQMLYNDTFAKVRSEMGNKEKIQRRILP